MNNYVILFIGWTIGQCIYATIKAWDIQKKNETIDFPHAIRLVYKQFGSFVFALLMLIFALFVMPDIIRKVLTDENITGNSKIIRDYFRVSCVGFGFVCQYFGLLFFSKLNKAVKKAVDPDNTDQP